MSLCEASKVSGAAMGSEEEDGAGAAVEGAAESSCPVEGMLKFLQVTRRPSCLTSCPTICLWWHLLPGKR